MTELAMKRPSRSGVVWSSLILAGVMLASTLVASRQPLTREWALAAATLTALGTIAVAIVASRWSPYPRWSFLVAAALLAGSMIWTAVLSPDLAQWRKDVAMNWMFPYYFLIAGFTGRVKATGVCAPTSRWAPWLLVGVGFVLAVVNLVTSYVGARW